MDKVNKSYLQWILLTGNKDSEDSRRVFKDRTGLEPIDDSSDWIEVCGNFVKKDIITFISEVRLDSYLNSSKFDIGVKGEHFFPVIGDERDRDSLLRKLGVEK